MLPIIYLGGMVGYSCSLVTRTLGVGKDAIFFLGTVLLALISSSERYAGMGAIREIKVKLIVLLGSIGEVCIAIIGIICPPLAYSLDEHLYSHPVISFNSMGSIFNNDILFLSLKDKVVFKRAYQFLTSERFIEESGAINLKYFMGWVIIKKLELLHATNGTVSFDFQRRAGNERADNEMVYLSEYEVYYQNAHELDLARNLKLVIEGNDDGLTNFEIEFYNKVIQLAVVLVAKYNENIINLLSQTEARLII